MVTVVQLCTALRLNIGLPHQILTSVHFIEFINTPIGTEISDSKTCITYYFVREKDVEGQLEDVSKMSQQGFYKLITFRVIFVVHCSRIFDW